MTLPATDNFNRADGAVGSNYTNTASGGFQVLGNRLKGTSFNYNQAYWSADAFNGDHYSQLTYISNASEGGPAARVQSGLAYLYRIRPSNDVHLSKNISGSYTDLQTGITTPSANDLCYIEANGSTITIKTNGTQVGQATDSAITGGSAGFWDYDTQAVYDDFVGDNLAGVASIPPGLGPVVQMQEPFHLDAALMR